MEAKERTVVSYEAKNGHAAFDEWLESFGDSEIAGTIIGRIERVEGGLFGDCGPVGEGVTELRIDVGPGYRVYFGQLGDIVILLNGGDKSTQQRDIKEAKRLWNEFKTREVQ